MILAGLIDHEAIVTDVLGVGDLTEAINLFESVGGRHIEVVIDAWNG